MRRMLACLLVPWVLCAMAFGEDSAKKPPKKADAPPPPPIEAPAPYVLYPYPAGAQRGSTIEVTLTGQNLKAISGLRADDPGISAKFLRSADIPVPPNLNSATIAANSSATLSFTLTSNVAIGTHELQLLTPGGVSNRFRFQAGQFAEVLEKEPNSSRAQAETLPKLPVVVNGQIEEGDRDFFQFPAKAGQTIVLQVDARSLVPYIADAVPGWNDACITLSDSTGHELSTVDDFRFHPDPVMFFHVPSDGNYVVQIHDAILRGRGDFVYRMTIGETPYVTDVFPLGGKRGASTKVALRGVNLPSQEMEVKVPEQGPAKVDVCVTRDGVVSNVVPFGASDLAGVMEPSDEKAKPMRVEVPSVIDGRIDAPGEVDSFAFTARKGDKLVLEVCARRLGSPLDSILSLYDAKKTKVAENDDSPDPEEGLLTFQADSRILYTVPADGEYLLKLRDVQGKGGPEYAWRLRIAPQQPDFALRVSPDNPRAARGDCAVLTVTAIRKEGFAEPIQIAVAGLPEGFVVSPAVIPAGQDKCSLTVCVPSGAKLDAVSPAVTGTATFVGKTVSHAAIPAEEMTQSFTLKHLVPSRDVALSVIEEGPYSLSLAQPLTQPIELPQGGQVEVVVKVARAGADNTKGPIQLKPQSPIPAVGGKGAAIAKDKEEATITITATRQAPVGSILNVIVTGVLHVGKEEIVRTVSAIPVRITAAVAPPPEKQQPKKDGAPKKE